MRLLALPVLAFAFSTAASANVLWRGDYETGDLTQWAHIDGRADRLTVVQSPVRQGKYALRVEPLADVAPALAAPPPPPPPPAPDGGTDLPGSDPSDAGIAVKGSSMYQLPSGGCATGSGNVLTVIGLLGGALFMLRRRLHWSKCKPPSPSTPPNPPSTPGLAG